jgi:ribosomal protein S18 acetylase RimI-like enzyme
MNDVSVRRLGPGDEQEVERFDAAFDGPSRPAQTAAFLSDPRHHLIVSYVDGEPAGFISATEILQPDRTPELFLNELGVAEPMRRRGAATAMMEALVRLGRALGCTAIWVLTDEGNPAAMATYAKAGATWDGRRHIMYELDLTAEPDEGGSG